MRKILLAIALAGLVLAACAEEDAAQPASGSPECRTSDPPVLEPGVLTVSTSRPAFPPWFEGNPRNYSGYEGELATQIAERMDLEIKWVAEPFDQSYAPGNKDYDFGLQQVTITDEREQAVDFSDAYFNNNQGVLTLENNPVAEVDSIEGLKEHRLGAVVGTTSLSLINSVIQPQEEPAIFNDTNDAKTALEGGRIDAFVTDLVTTVYLRDVEMSNAVVIGQYPEQEQFGLVFEQGNPLRLCVNQILADMKEDGTLEELQDRFLQQYLRVPSLA
jgi:polar amino acid transport system substrate-binding protein